MKKPVIIPPPEPERERDHNMLPYVVIGSVAFWGVLALILWF